MTIHCNMYDYVEIACLYRLSVVATLNDNRKVAGIVTTTISKPIEQNNAACTAKEKCMVIKTDSGDKVYVVLTQIVSLTSVHENPCFRTLSFINGKMTK